MIRVGVTGGIGSGKTTVCKILQDLGAFILNADDLAKNIMTDDQTVKNEIVQTFGRDAYTEDGTLNREYLANEAFGKGRVEELNHIVHPKIPDAAQEIMDEAATEGYEVFVYEAALLLQNLRPEELDYVILVLADEDKRIERVTKRDEVEAELVMDRIERQQNFDTLTHLADIVIKNNGGLKKLREQVEKIYYDILTKE